jgi:predicted dithiol-disulfide oxidoreductase (DUF899 family)
VGSRPPGELFDGRRQLIVYRAFYGPEVTTYFIDARGDEQMGGTWNYLDITATPRGGDPCGLPEVGILQR